MLANTCGHSVNGACPIQGAAALGNLGRSVVRATRAEVRQSALDHARLRQRLFLELEVGEAFPVFSVEPFAQEPIEPELREPARERLGDQRGRQLVMSGE